MTGKNTPPIVHEAEAQRQHIRIPLPVRVEVGGTTLTAADWSNGGLGLQLDEGAPLPAAFAQGRKLEAVLHYPFEGFSMSLPVTLEITHIDTAKGRIGCSFANLNRQQKSVIQYFVTAYISGEIIRVNDIMDVVSRNNFTRARNVPDALAGLSAAAIRRRQIGKFIRIFLLTGIATLLLGYVALSIYERLFIMRATTGRVTAEMLSVDAPAGGKVFYNPLAPDTQVKQGEPLLTVSTATGNVIAVDSPCDCIVKRRILENNRLARKAEPLLELVRPDAATAVSAYFPHKAAVNLAVGDEALLTVPGAHKNLRGKITAIQAGYGLKGNAQVTIKPATALPASSVDDPVEVRIDTLHLF